jgi:Flp pilus assembly protein protease CpaA
MLNIDLAQVILFILVVNLIINILMVYILYERLLKCREKLWKFAEWYRKQVNREKLFNKALRDVK